MIFYIRRRKRNLYTRLYFHKKYEHPDFTTAGVRIRGTKECTNFVLGDTSCPNVIYELTYKKFLGKANGMNHFLELTEKINDVKTFSIDNIDNCLSSKDLKDVLKDMHKLCFLFPSVIIYNFRKVYYYVLNDMKLEIVLEDIKYQLAEKVYFEKMLEIELLSGTLDTKEVRKVIDYFSSNYHLSIPTEGKSTRALKVLSGN